LKDSLQWDGRSGLALIQEVFNPESSPWITDDTEQAETARMDMQLVLDKSRAMLAEHEPDEEHPEDAPSELRRVARTLRYQIATREPFVPGQSADIHLATLWGAKRVTATHVYVLGLCAETMPGIKRDEYPGTESDYFDEQRRLFYVCLTRSKRTLVLSRPLSILKFEAARLGITVGATGTSQFASLQICPFLRDIVRYVPRAQAGKDWRGCH
jgi:superfamily I DNA/RNA helicase